VVDFFFMLSGFVIAYAYDDRWTRMMQWEVQPTNMTSSIFHTGVVVIRGKAGLPVTVAVAARSPAPCTVRDPTDVCSALRQ
jgi:hypothetical protein